jgi:hypothetical protein
MTTAIRNVSGVGCSCSLCGDCGWVSLERDGFWASACRWCEQGERVRLSLSRRGISVDFEYDRSEVAA